MRLPCSPAIVLLFIVEVCVALPSGGENLTYTSGGILTGAFVRFPSNTSIAPNGVLLIWHGTNLPPTSGTVESEFSDNSDIFANSSFDDLIVVMPQQIGLGNTFGAQKQKWQQLVAVQNDGNAVLAKVYDEAKTRYSLANGTVLRLFMCGHSQGGTSALAYHFYYQSSTAIQNLYDLKVTVASAGHYSADVWESSVFTPYTSYAADANIVASYSADLLPVSKKMQNVLLCHLLHTYKASQEPMQDSIVYEAAYPNNIAASAGDDWTQMGQVIGLVIGDQAAVTQNPVQAISGYDAKPPFVTDATWASLTNASSALRQALRKYLVENSIVEAFAQTFSTNSRDVSVFYACNDLNVPCQHGKLLPNGHRILHNDVTPSGDAISSLFERHSLSWTKAWQYFFAQMIEKRNEPAVAPSTTASTTAAATEDGVFVGGSMMGSLTISHMLMSVIVVALIGV